ncbi:unnamed protein product, partial [Brassica oleracea]
MTRTLIRGVNLLSNCYGILKEKVVLLSVDGVSVGNDQPALLSDFSKSRGYAYMDLADVSESLSGKIPRKAGEQIVILSQQVLEDDVNAGYRDLEDLQVTCINVKNFKRFIRASSTIVELKDTTLTTMFVCGQGREDFDYVVEIDANITMNKEQERSLKFVDKELKLDVVDR